MTRALVLLLVLAPAARANVWQSAIDDGHAAAAQHTYDFELEQGDTAVEQANAKSASTTVVKKQLQLAEQHYRAAAAAKPDEGEPYWRIGRMLYSFYFECWDQFPVWAGSMSPVCDPLTFDRARAQAVIDAWDAFEARAPLDPRLSAFPLADLLGRDSEILFHRAILHTKLATHDHLAAAALDYEKVLARGDANGLSNETTLSNLAETYMMLDRLEEAIDTYHEALRHGATSSTQFGLAVALDRAGLGAEATERITILGKKELAQFSHDVLSGHTFFVPEGEKFYYFALAKEALGMPDEAIDDWKAYIDSGAHAEFQPRAKQHLDHLRAEQRRRPQRVVPPPVEDF
jgi:tetratricopeptide (TPR) repeat protein